MSGSARGADSGPRACVRVCALGGRGVVGARCTEATAAAARQRQRQWQRQRQRQRGRVRRQRSLQCGARARAWQPPSRETTPVHATAHTHAHGSALHGPGRPMKHNTRHAGRRVGCTRLRRRHPPRRPGIRTMPAQSPAHQDHACRERPPSGCLAPLPRGAGTPPPAEPPARRAAGAPWEPVRGSHWEGARERDAAAARGCAE